MTSKLAALLTVSAALLHAQTPHTVLDGVFTAAQAARGQAEYDSHCSGCHGPNLDGGGQAPALRSSSFLDAWREDYLSSLFQHIQTRMPPGSGAGSLKASQYTDIVAYLLEFNKFPTGADELTAAGLETTLLVGPGGPQPLPASATVRAVGCLARDGDAWTLTRSTPPSRVRNGSETDAAELERSAHIPPGALTLRLANLEDDHTEADLRAQVAKRVQVKGVLNGQAPNARVYVLSFEPLGQACDR